MTNQFNFKCTDEQKKQIQDKAKKYGFASVSAYVKFVSLTAIIQTKVKDEK